MYKTPVQGPPLTALSSTWSFNKIYAWCDREPWALCGGRAVGRGLPASVLGAGALESSRGCVGLEGETLSLLLPGVPDVASPRVAVLGLGRGLRAVGAGRGAHCPDPSPVELVLG